MNEDLIERVQGLVRAAEDDQERQAHLERVIDQLTEPPTDKEQLAYEVQRTREVAAELRAEAAGLTKEAIELEAMASRWEYISSVGFERYCELGESIRQAGAAMRQGRGHKSSPTT